MPMVVTGGTEQECLIANRPVRKQIAFYASTPACREVLEIHGWANSRRHSTPCPSGWAWDEMGPLIDDQMLETFAVVAAPEDLPAILLGRFGALADWLVPTLFSRPLKGLSGPMVAQLRARLASLGS